MKRMTLQMRLRALVIKTAKVNGMDEFDDEIYAALYREGARSAFEWAIDTSLIHGGNVDDCMDEFDLIET